MDADANADAGGSTIALHELRSGELINEYFFLRNIYMYKNNFILKIVYEHFLDTANRHTYV